MESALGHDFSNVRVHEGSQAEALGAIAYTRGRDIHFAPGKYSPNSYQGQKLLGHELAHVVQQRAGRVAIPQGKGAPINDSPALEAEADALGKKAAAAREPVRGGSVQPTLSPRFTSSASQAPVQAFGRESRRRIGAWMAARGRQFGNWASDTAAPAIAAGSRRFGRWVKNTAAPATARGLKHTAKAALYSPARANTVLKSTGGLFSSASNFAHSHFHHVDKAAYHKAPDQTGAVPFGQALGIVGGAGQAIGGIAHGYSKYKQGKKSAGAAAQIAQGLTTVGTNIGALAHASLATPVGSVVGGSIGVLANVGRSVRDYRKERQQGGRFFPSIKKGTEGKKMGALTSALQIAGGATLLGAGLSNPIGWGLLGGAALIGGGYAGYKAYKAYKNKPAPAAAAAPSTSKTGLLAGNNPAWDFDDSDADDVIG